MKHQIKGYIYRSGLLQHGLLIIKRSNPSLPYSSDVTIITMEPEIQFVGFHGFTEKHVASKMRKYLIKNDLTEE